MTRVEQLLAASTYEMDVAQDTSYNPQKQLLVALSAINLSLHALVHTLNSLEETLVVK